MAFPDNEVQVRSIARGGSGGAQESTFSGTHLRPLASPEGEIPPSGRSVSLRFTVVHTIQEDRVRTFHLCFDRADLMAQLGLLPSPAPPGRRIIQEWRVGPLPARPPSPVTRDEGRGVGPAPWAHLPTISRRSSAMWTAPRPAITTP